jgi:hypothetical protein
MRPVALIAVATVLFGAAAYAQTLTEFGAAAAGGTVGGASGKKVSEGVSTIFGKVDKATSAAAAAIASDGKKASADSSKGALIEAGPGRPAASVPPKDKPAPAAAPVRKPKPAEDVAANAVPAPPRRDDVPPPPPPTDNRPRAAAKPSHAPVPAVAAAPVPAPPPPPVVVPAVTLEDLQTVTAGMTRGDVLKLGPPSSRITMDDDGNLLEIFSYRTQDAELGDRPLGTIRLNNGAVSSVQLRP